MLSYSEFLKKYQFTIFQFDFQLYNEIIYKHKIVLVYTPTNHAVGVFDDKPSAMRHAAVLMKTYNCPTCTRWKLYSQKCVKS